MFKDLLKKERQKPWLTPGLAGMETHPYEEALALRTKTYAEDFADKRMSSDIGERRTWAGSRDVLAIARTASGL